MSSILVDVGAGHQDEYETWFKTRPVTRIFSIEPHPELARAVRERFKQHLVNKKLIVGEFLCGAFVDSSASRAIRKEKFYLCSTKSSSSTLAFRQENIHKWKYSAGAKELRTVGETEIECYPLSDYLMKELGAYRAIDLLNIDVQGNAIDVLRGISSDDWRRTIDVGVKVHAIEWDLYQGQTSAEEVERLMEANGFVKTGESFLSRNQEKILMFSNIKKPRIIATKAAPLRNDSQRIIPAAKPATKRVVGAYQPIVVRPLPSRQQCVLPR
jgi:FkbM family methyltransferase